jgi:uncharacterized lipoprotein YbaY
MACRPEEPAPATTEVPTAAASTVPVAATPEPTAEPTPEPTAEPTPEPTAEPTDEPTPEPTAEPTLEPTVEPTPEPTAEPTLEPAESPLASEAPLATEMPIASDEPVGIIEPAVTGAITLPEDAVLPEGATWSIELLYVPDADAPAEVVGAASGAVADIMATEIPFAIAIDPDLIDDELEYTLSATVTDAEENLLYVNDIDTVTPGVIEGEPQEDVVVQVQDAPAEAEPAEVEPAASEAMESPAA